MVSIEIIILLSITCFTGAVIQTVTGFGFGIFAMTLLPYFVSSYVSSVTLSTSFSFVIVLIATVQLRKQIDYKLLIAPLFGYALTNAFIIAFSVTQSDDTLKKMLGVFLFLLSIYFMFYSHKIKIKAKFTNGIIAGGISGILGGLFGTGGPPIVIYFLSTTTDSVKYLATIQCYFLLSNAFNLFNRALNGLFTEEIMQLWVFGLVAIGVGMFAGKKINKKVDDKLLRKMVYGFMSISGLIMILM